MYFSQFPTTKFKDVTLLDITRKVQLDKLVESNALAYMNYTVQEGEKPEDVAFYYYDDPSYAWLVLSSNNIVDPYTHWPKDETSFQEYLKVQYADQAGTTGDAVIEWTKNATIGANIVEYQSRLDPNIKINRSSYINLFSNAGFEVDKVKQGQAYQIVNTGGYPENTTIWSQLTGFNTAGQLNIAVQVGNTFQAAVDGDTIQGTQGSDIRLSTGNNEAVAEFYPVRIYDYEVQLNEQRREIQLVNKSLLPSIQNQLERVLNGS